MGFLHRLGYYLGGFSAGLVFLFFILNGKRTQCHYGPQARVIDNLSKKKWSSQTPLPASVKLDSVGIQKILNPATVDFNTSDTQRDSCKLYVIESSDAAFTVENCQKEVFVVAYKPLP